MVLASIQITFVQFILQQMSFFFKRAPCDWNLRPCHKSSSQGIWRILWIVNAVLTFENLSSAWLILPRLCKCGIRRGWWTSSLKCLCTASICFAHQMSLIIHPFVQMTQSFGNWFYIMDSRSVPMKVIGKVFLGVVVRLCMLCYLCNGSFIEHTCKTTERLFGCYSLLFALYRALQLCFLPTRLQFISKGLTEWFDLIVPE